jgi:outer membrane protein TolC
MPQEALPEQNGVVDRARIQRPEFKQLAEGMAARTALVEAAKANYYPDVFLAGMVSWAYSDGRDRVKNPYISDTFQHSYGGVALGIKWKLDFGITAAKVAAEQAQLNRLTSTKQYADSYIPLQTQKAWFEMQEAQRNVTITKDAFQSAKKWGTAALANFDFGIGNPRDVFDAVGVYGKMKAAHYQAIFDYKMAKANLDYAMGEYPVPLQK